MSTPSRKGLQVAWESLPMPNKHDQDVDIMTTLAETQLRFRDAVVQGNTQQVRSVQSLLLGGRNPEKRLVVHQRNYRASLVEALLVKFPATEWLLGTSLLADAAARFVREHPPQAPCIAEYGAAFPDFLSQCPEAAGIRYLSDFAKLEWYVGRVAVAIDDRPISNKEFSTIDPAALPDTLFTLQSGLHYLNASWPVDELMTLYLADTAPERFEMSPAEVWIEVRGARGEFHFSRLDAAECIFRRSVLEGKSIGEAAERALDLNAGFDPGKGLAALITAGLITTIGQMSDDRQRLAGPHQATPIKQANL
jgi:hypothetical protein